MNFHCVMQHCFCIMTNDYLVCCEQRKVIRNLPSVFMYLLRSPGTTAKLEAIEYRLHAIKNKLHHTTKQLKGTRE